MNVKFSKVGEKEVTRAMAGEFVKYFSSAGTYTYHDSLNPELEGEIIVQ